MGQNALTIFETPDIASWLFLPEVHISFFYGFDFVVCTGTCLLSVCLCCAVCVLSSRVCHFGMYDYDVDYGLVLLL